MLNIIDRLKQNNILQLFTIYLRYLIGSAFIIAAIGMGKLNGTSNLLNSQNFPMDESTPPIILFFKVMSESGLYWQFIGWTQIVVGILLLTQRFAKLGALIFFGLILNIFVITISYEFKGTPIVTGLMLLATTYLLLWDAKSFQFLFRKKGVLEESRLKIADHSFWGWLGVIMVISIIFLTIMKANMFINLGVIFLEGLIGLLVFFIRKRKRNYARALSN